MIINIKHLSAIFAVFWGLSTSLAFSQTPGETLPPWQPGQLDLHHINTGRGDAAFYILPDGTTMLVDAGDMSETRPRTLSPRTTSMKPDNSQSAGAWIVDYIKQFSPKNRPLKLDYALITHFHSDHMGEVDASSPQSHFGDYRVSGITEVVEKIPVKKLIDRTYPNYGNGINLTSPDINARLRVSKDPNDKMLHYWRFLLAQQKHNAMVTEQISVGDKTQLVLNNNPEHYPSFEIRNIHGNGKAWTGWRNETFNLFAPGADFGENELSLGIRLSYGDFDYYTGGDIPGVAGLGQQNLSRVENLVAPVIGPLDVATLNHHGSRDSQSSYYVRTVRPKVWIQQNWSADHPDNNVLARLTSTQLYPGPRYLFATAMLPAARHVIGNEIDEAYSATSGHIVVRVNKGGADYRVYVLNDDKIRKISKVFGPIISR